MLLIKKVILGLRSQHIYTYKILAGNFFKLSPTYPFLLDLSMMFLNKKNKDWYEWCEGVLPALAWQRCFWHRYQDRKFAACGCLQGLRRGRFGAGLEELVLLRDPRKKLMTAGWCCCSWSKPRTLQKSLRKLSTSVGTAACGCLLSKAGRAQWPSCCILSCLLSWSSIWKAMPQICSNCTIANVFFISNDH